MQFGIVMFPTDYAVDPAELGRMVEERGFDSLFFPEHTHIPVGIEVERHYKRTYDPFVALTAVAAATERVKVATGICLVPQRDPITTAKEVASIDFLSGGRFLFGVGAGWNEPELRNHGTDPKRRFGVMRERIEAMKVIWAEDEAEYHGRYVDFDPIWSWPKPVQKPHPPIIVGGVGEKALDRVIAYGDEWMPNKVDDLDWLAERIQVLERKAAEAGRERIPVSLFGGKDDPELIERYREAGVDRCLFRFSSLPRDEIEPLLDHAAETARAAV